MDKPSDFQKFIHDIVEHEIEHAVEDPRHVNRSVGEAMRHIGNMLFANATGYLPIRQEEILCKPERVDPVDNSAVLLTRRALVAKQSFYVLSTGKTDGDGHRNFSIYAYQPDEFDLNATKFLQLPPPVGNEVIRQLHNLIKTDGVTLLCCTVVPNYFEPIEPPQQPDDPMADARYEALQEAAEPTGGLPPVTASDLL